MGTTASTPGGHERHEDFLIGPSSILAARSRPPLHATRVSSIETDRGDPAALLFVDLAVFRPRSSEDFLLGLGSEQDLSEAAGVGQGHGFGGASFELAQGLLGRQIGGVVLLGAGAEGAIRIGPSLDIVQLDGGEADFCHGGRDVQGLVASQCSKGVTYIPCLNPASGLVEDALLELLRTGANHLDGRLCTGRHVVFAATWASGDDAGLVGGGAPERNLVLCVAHVASETVSRVAVQDWMWLLSVK
ncbi:hypothetical protein GGR57DRAFT_476993 [Xylariaceae sp. FL1272]|nr:hypothetical protein GGR57DRAFT_476993 [Xylariaceae sp. FL1272]